MFVITKLSPTKSGRMAVFFNGHFDFSVDMETAVLQNLTVGREFTGPEYDALRGDASYRQAREKAFRLLSYKSYTSAMLAQRLSQDFAPETVEDVIARLQELGLLNDADYALRCGRDLINLKKYSLQRVGQELRRRGIDPCTVEDTLAALEEEDDPGERIQQIILKKYLRGLGEEKGRRRAVNGLVRLGYRYEDIKREISAVLEEYGEENSWEE